MTNVSLAFPLDDPALAESLAQELQIVEELLQEAVVNTHLLADQASKHLVSAGGKRLRPLLTLLVSHLGSGVTPQIRTAGVIVELTHLASLYHDDVMDSAPLRRGAPSAHEVWGNNVAILTGDLLFARASRLTADLGPDAVAVQAETFERLCMGQLQETVGPAEQDDPVAHYIQVLADKTASLLATSAYFGARYSGCSKEIQQTVANYGEKVGVAFQLADDVIDLTSSGEVTGKTQGTDLREQVPTMPVLLLRKKIAGGEGTAADLELIAKIDSDLSSDEALHETVALLKSHEVVDQTRELSKQWARDAIAELEQLPAGAVRQALSAFAQALVERSS